MKAMKVIIKAWNNTRLSEDEMTRLLDELAQLGFYEITVEEQRVEEKDNG